MLDYKQEIIELLKSNEKLFSYYLGNNPQWLKILDLLEYALIDEKETGNILNPRTS